MIPKTSLVFVAFYYDGVVPKEEMCWVLMLYVFCGMFYCHSSTLMEIWLGTKSKCYSTSCQEAGSLIIARECERAKVLFFFVKLMAVWSS